MKFFRRKRTNPEESGRPVPPKGRSTLESIWRRIESWSLRELRERLVPAYLNFKLNTPLEETVEIEQMNRIDSKISIVQEKKKIEEAPPTLGHMIITVIAERPRRKVGETERLV